MHSIYSLIRPWLFRLDPERSHDLTLGVLARLSRSRSLCQLVKRSHGGRLPRLESTVMGIRFANPVGLAAGLDKQGNCANALSALGFGWVELGTVTPLPQPGNDKPRMFRLVDHDAIINRMGFNSIGLDAFLDNVARAQQDIVKGINIGKNAATPVEHAADDYVQCMEAVYPHADYITINISSPNTANLRDLQQDQALDSLLAEIRRSADRLAEKYGHGVPLVLKIAPDLEPVQVVHIAALLRKYRIDGVAATNTTLSRGGVGDSPLSEQAGGLSGKPLGRAATDIVRGLYQELGDDIPIIGIGGIHSADDAMEKFAAGASLIQLYTGFIYRGPALIREIVNALEHQLGGQDLGGVVGRLHSQLDDE